MSGKNKALLIGHVGKDPETKTLEDGKRVSSFSLATSETYTKDGHKIQNTEWHNIVCWNGLSDVVSKYVKKGQALYVEGKITNRSWESNGQKHYRTEIVAQELVMIGGRKPEDSQQDSEFPKDDLPF